MNLADKSGKILLAHYVYWYGKPNTTHAMNRYVSTDPDVIGDQLSSIQNLGIQGIIALTYGAKASPFIHQAVMEACRQCSERKMLFALCFDPWTVKDLVTGNLLPSPQREQAYIAALAHPDTQTMLNSRCYLPERYVLDFSTGANLAVVAAGAGVGNITFLAKHIGFSWPEKTNTMAVLKSDNANPGMKIPGLCPQFNNGAPSDRNKDIQDLNQPCTVLESQAGNFWWDQVALLPASAKYAQVITANDYTEGTVLEPFASMCWGRIGK